MLYDVKVQHVKLYHTPSKEAEVQMNAETENNGISGKHTDVFIGTFTSL